MAFGPITSWQIEGGRVEVVTDSLFLSSKITVDGGYRHEIRRQLLLGRKAMTNLESVLKSRDITLLTKVCIVKAMVFPVIMHSCESWTVKAEHQRIDAFKLWCWRSLLSVFWTARSNQSVIREANTEDSLEKTLMLGKIEGKRRRGWKRMTWLDGIINSLDMNLGKPWEMVRDRESWHCFSLWGCEELNTLAEWTTKSAWFILQIKYQAYLTTVVYLHVCLLETS